MTQYECGYCQKSGHNKAGCPERKKAVADREAMRTDRLMQIIAKFEKFAATMEHIEREIDLIWMCIHEGDAVTPERPGKQKVMFDF